MPKATGADTPAKPHMLTINERKSAQLTGVKEVLSFDSHYSAVIG